MMNTAIIDPFIEQAQAAQNLRIQLFRTTGTEQYENVLQRVQQYFAARLTNDVAQMGEQEWKEAILKYITDYSVTCSLTDRPDVLTHYLYHDMAAWSFISREGLLEQRGFEELDINGWNDVDIIVAGRRQKTDYSFLSPKHAGDIIRRMLGATSQKFDEAVPIAVTDLGPSVRIAAIRPPVLDEDRGLACSIRKVSGSTITREKLLETTLDEKMLDMLLLFVHHGVSICFSGETGAGKTALAGYLLHTAARTQRTFTIEQGSREWNFLRYGEDGKIQNSIIHTKTRPSPNEEQDITQEYLLETALRFDPSVIGVGEMRSREAYAAAEASITGHTVVSTVHAKKAALAPERIMGLCKKAYDFSDDTLMQLVVNAFPIQVHQQQLRDKSRRVTEIIEVTGYENGQITYNTLVKFHIQDNILDEHGNTRVVGEFRWVSPLSEGLHQAMLQKGASRARLDRFTRVE